MTIDFEKDQQDAMRKTDNIQSLADQVEKLESLNKRLELQEENMKSTKAGNPKINIMGASGYGQFKFLLPEFSQMIFSPGPLIFKIRQGL